MSTPAPSYYRRPLPDGHIAFSSPEGRRLFREALDAGGMEGWFALAEQFHTQAEPAFCGLATLVVVLNALEIDPGRIWKGPWRWYGEDLLDCCLPLEKVKERGVTLDELACLARCNGATAEVVRADLAPLERLRAQVRESTAAARGPVLVASYSRAVLGQAGDGHFSPVAGYHAGRDLALILDVARFKYPPHWVPLEPLRDAMTAVDPATGRSRGWIVLRRAPTRTLPIYFRLSACDGLGPLVEMLTHEAPALLAASPADSPEVFVAAFTAAVEARMADRLCQSLGAESATRERLPPEYDAAVETLLAELRETPAFQAVSRARLATGPGRVPDEILATLLLALPEDVLATLPDGARAAMCVLRDPSRLGTHLGEEIAALREQMVQLGRWQFVGAQPPTQPQCSS